MFHMSHAVYYKSLVDNKQTLGTNISEIFSPM